MQDIEPVLPELKQRNVPTAPEQTSTAEQSIQDSNSKYHLENQYQHLQTVSQNQNTEANAGKVPDAVPQPASDHSPLDEKAHPVQKGQSITEQPNPLTDDTIDQNTTSAPMMEVHHPHHLAHKKKWSEYLLEFFMLFFAVFLGFLVENYREHRIEEARTGKHMHTMVENLKYDTSRFENARRRNLEVTKGLDSFRFQINEAMLGRINANKLYYYYWKYSRFFFNPVTNDAAMAQLKSSGMLRMVHNDALINEMGDYYERMQTILAAAKGAADKKLDQLNNTYKLFFSFQGFDEILQQDSISSFLFGYYEKIASRNPPLKLTNSSPVALEGLYNDLSAYELALRHYNEAIGFCKQGADSLMMHIIKDYGFESETNNR